MFRFLLNIRRLLDRNIADNWEVDGGMDWGSIGDVFTDSALEGSATSTIARTAAKVKEIMTGIVGPCLSVIASIGVIYMIVLGVQYAKAESDEKRMNCKKRMINLVIGILVMIVLITLCFALKWDEVIPGIFDYFRSEK